MAIIMDTDNGTTIVDAHNMLHAISTFKYCVDHTHTPEHTPTPTHTHTHIDIHILMKIQCSMNVYIEFIVFVNSYCDCRSCVWDVCMHFRLSPRFAHSTNRHDIGNSHICSIGNINRVVKFPTICYFMWKMF